MEYISLIIQLYNKWGSPLKILKKTTKRKENKLRYSLVISTPIAHNYMHSLKTISLFLHNSISSQIMENLKF